MHGIKSTVQPDGWEVNELGQRVYNPMRGAMAQVEAKSVDQKSLIARKEALVNRVAEMEVQIGDALNRIVRLEQKNEAMVAIINAQTKKLNALKVPEPAPVESAPEEAAP
jgi:hypothetical protein